MHCSAGDIVLVESISPRLGRLKVGEIVLAYSPDNPSRTVCKRIKGLGKSKNGGYMTRSTM